MRITIWDPPTDISNYEIKFTFNRGKADEKSDNNNKKSPDKIDNIVLHQSDPEEKEITCKGMKEVNQSTSLCRKEMLMGFIEKIRNLSTEIENQKDLIQDEDKTKTACVIPFIELLEYKVSNLTEVVPEYTADFGTKKGEKVDYAILKDDEVIMLIECKSFGTSLANVHVSQLFRYFSVVAARIAVLTDGDRYQFYTDLEEPNKMDDKPFLEFNMLDVQQQWVNELKRFTKSAFNLNAILTTASDLKYTKEIRRFMMEHLAPSEDFVRFILSHVYSGVETPEVVQQFTDIVGRVLKEFLPEVSEELDEGEEPGEPTGKEWTSERFKTLVSKAKYREDYEARNQTEKLCELGADLMALVEREQWNLTHKFNKYYFAFYFGSRLVFGVHLQGCPRLRVWSPKDHLEKWNDDLYDGQYPYESYDDSNGRGIYPEHVRVENIEKLLTHAYCLRAGLL